jgi:hypothetical protein
MLTLLLACREEEDTVCNSDFVLTVAVTDARCGQANGMITITPKRPSGAVKYRLNGGPEQDASIFDDLPADDYEVSIRDESGCTISTMVTIADQPVTIEAIPTATASACGENTGSISVAVSGGTEPYTFRLDSGVFVTADQFAQLAPGSYTATVQDADGCTVTVDARVPSKVSFATDIKPLITTNCAITGCHAGGRVPNFTTKEDIFSYAAKIKERTGERSMPPPGSGRELTDAQIAELACWVDDGAPDN